MSLLEQILPCDPNKPYVFISYNSNDSERVLEDVLEFQRRGYNVWLDNRNLDKTNPSWETDALKAIESYYCKLVVFYVSRWSLTSAPCYKELCHTRNENAVAYHNEEVKYIAVELEPIGNIDNYKDRVFEELMENEKVPLEERQMCAGILRKFIKDFFPENKKVRIHPRDETDRPIDYYTDVINSFPNKTQIRKITDIIRPEKEPLNAAPSVPTVKILKEKDFSEKEPLNPDTPVSDTKSEANSDVKDTPVPDTPVSDTKSEANSDAKATPVPDPMIRRETEDCEKEAAEKRCAEAREYYDTGDFVLAVQIWQELAEQGVAPAQYKLGMCFFTGSGVPKNFSEAVKWYRKAAEQNDVSAQYHLGWCYEKGFGKAQNYTEAAKWYRKAAAHGHEKAQCNLAWCYRVGSGVPQNPQEAVRWYLASAEQGYALAQSNLGWCYEKGFGVPHSYEEAARWYREAAEQGIVFAQCNLAWCYHNGCGVPKDYAEAVRWYKKAAEQGNASAKRALTRKELKKYL